MINKFTNSLVIPNEVIRNNRMFSRQWMKTFVMFCRLRKLNQEGAAYGKFYVNSFPTLRKVLGISKSSFYRLLTNLEESNMIRRKPKYIQLVSMRSVFKTCGLDVEKWRRNIFFIPECSELDIVSLLTLYQLMTLNNNIKHYKRVNDDLNGIEPTKHIGCTVKISLNKLAYKIGVKDVHTVDSAVKKLQRDSFIGIEKGGYNKFKKRNECNVYWINTKKFILSLRRFKALTAKKQKGVIVSKKNVSNKKKPLIQYPIEIVNFFNELSKNSKINSSGRKFGSNRYNRIVTNCIKCEDGFNFNMLNDYVINHINHSTECKEVPINKKLGFRDSSNVKNVWYDKFVLTNTTSGHTELIKKIGDRNLNKGNMIYYEDEIKDLMINDRM